MITSRLEREGWVVLMSVPALFLCAFFLSANPSLLKIPICAVKSFLDLDCPGCGLTHSIIYLCHLEIRKSILFHPLGVVIALFLCYLFLRTLLILFTGRSYPPILSQKSRDLILVVFLAAMIGQWIVKLVLRT